MEIVEFWRKLEKNATQVMIFLPHYMWAENNNEAKTDFTLFRLILADMSQNWKVFKFRGKFEQIKLWN